jgi:hypothetical protein
MLPPNNRNLKGSGFVNLNRVLQANRGNKLGETVASGVQQVGQNIRQQTQQAQQSFQAEAEKNRLDNEQNKQERANILGRFNSQTNQQENSDSNRPLSGNQANNTQTPVSGVQVNAAHPQSGFTPVSDEEVNKFARFRSGAYSGPRELQDIDQLAGQAMDAEQVGQLTRSTGGRQELLRRFVGGQDYNQGKQMLDTTLLGLTGQKGLAQARRETRGLSEELARANESASQYAQELANRANIFGQETREQLQQTRNPIMSGIEDRVKTVQEQEAQKQERFQRVQDIISGKGDFANIPQEQRAILGLNAAAEANLLSQDDVQALVGQGALLQRGLNVGADIASLVGERLRFNQAQNLNKAGLATDEERAKLMALNRLSGGLDSDFEFAGQDGRFQAGASRFDYDSLNREIQRLEDEKARNDAAYRAKLEEERKEQEKFFNRMVAGYGQGISSGFDYAGGVVESILSPGKFLSNPIGNTTETGRKGIEAIEGFTKAGVNQPLAFQEGLLKLNIGGKSLADTEVGKALLKMNEGYGNLVNKNLDYGFDVAKQFLNKPIDATGRVIGDVGRTIGNIGGSIGGAVSSVRKKFKKWFCFGPNTQVLMANGKYKKIKDISVGEEVALGGEVISNGEALATDLYQYGDVKVTGGHAVFENGKWKRVSDSQKSYPIGTDESVVYPIVTENHLIVTKNQVWADAFETDNFKTPDEYSLEVLNQNKPRNRKLQRFVEEYFGKDPNRFEKIKTPF